jgi:hypothetical protein
MDLVAVDKDGRRRRQVLTGCKRLQVVADITRPANQLPVRLQSLEAILAFLIASAA